MKKFYSLAVIALASASALALPVSPQMKDLSTPLRLKHSVQSKSTKMNAPSKDNEDVSWGEWQMAGTGTFTLDNGFEDFLDMSEWTGEFNGINVYSRTNSNASSSIQYKLEGIYNNADIIVDYDANTGLCKVMPQPTNIDAYGMPLNVVDCGTVFALYGEEWLGMSKEEVMEIADMYAEYTYFIPELGKFYLYLGYITEGIDDMLCVTDCTFQLDGMGDMAVSVDAETFYKDAADMKALITFSADVPLCRYGCFEGILTQEKIDAVLNNAEGVKSLTETSYVDLDSSKGPGMYSVIAVTYSDNGTPLEWNYAEYTYTPSSSEGWTSLGKGTFTTDTFESLFDISISPYEVEVEQNIENPALIRIVNPYGENCPYPELSLRAEGFDIYLVFDTSDPEKVFFKPTNLGIDTGGEWWIASNAGYFFEAIQGEKASKNSFGKFAEGEISFPAKSVLVTCENISIFGGNDGSWYYGNASGNLSLKLPTQTFVESLLENADSTPEYYNMQGIKLVSPTKGTMIIEHHGNTVTKKVIR